MLELIISIVGVAGIVYISMTAIKNLKEAHAKALEIAQGQQELSKDLLAYIDKNINERVVYATPESGYTNAHKFEKEEEQPKDEQESMEVDSELLEEINKPKAVEGE